MPSFIAARAALLLLGACMLATTCTAQRLTQAQKTAALNLHNQYRCNVSPAAKSMPRMEWDSVLEQVAQIYADTCPTDHNANCSGWFAVLNGGSLNNAPYVGENMGWGYSTVEASIIDYASEVADYNYASNTCATGKVCGHYTQIVWADSTRVGCAKSTTLCGGIPIYVCNYFPGGNYDEKPYTQCTSPCTNAACTPATTMTPLITTQTTKTTSTSTTTPRPTTSTTTTTATPTCPTTRRDKFLMCRDGTTCNGVRTPDCCAERGGRMRCNLNTPVMCVQKKCPITPGIPGTDYCCRATIAGCANLGGVLPVSQCPKPLAPA